MLTIWRAGLPRRVIPGLAVLLAATWCAVGLSAQPAAAATTAITVNGTQGGRTFDGIGAISGGGGNTRLLTDYPAAQQQQILDYLFKPGYGADLQILKVEIGGDTNSTDGSESSIEHARGSVNCNAGYEWWLMEQAKARNPNIKLYGLAWGAPGWIGSGNFWSTDMINYLIAWLNCAASHGLTINYLGGWNERGYNISWYEQLRSALERRPATQACRSSAPTPTGPSPTTWSPTPRSPARCRSSARTTRAGTCPAQTSCSEHLERGRHRQAAVGQRERLAGLQRRRARRWPAPINRGLPRREDDRVHQLADRRRDLPEPAVRHRRADRGQPAVVRLVHGRQAAWVTAQTTQFTAPGWTYIDSASGYLRRQPEQRQLRHAEVARTAPTGARSSRPRTPPRRRPSTSTSPAACPPAPCTCGPPTSTRPAPSNWFVHSADITPTGGSFSLTLQPGYVYSLTTTTGQGKGTATSPAPGSLSLPYSDNFDSDTAGQQPRTCPSCRARSRSSRARGGRSGQCVQQQAPVQPIEWDSNANPFTIGGNLCWSNYTVSADALIAAGRRGAAAGPGRHADRLLRRRTSTRTTCRSPTPAPGRSSATTPAARHHAGQRHRRRARHRHLAAPGADLQRAHDQRGDRRHHGRRRSPTARTPPARSASASTATRPTSSTTCRSPRSAPPRRPGRSSR